MRMRMRAAEERSGESGADGQIAGGRAGGRAGIGIDEN